MISTVVVVLLVAPAPPAEGPIVFEDVTRAVGLADHLEQTPPRRAWRYAHGAGWGDVDGDGRPDLYLGAFAARPWYQGDDAPTPNRLFLNRDGKFQVHEHAAIEFGERNARCAGVLFADLDDDDDLDLVVTNHVTRPDHVGSKLFENVGKGAFRDATPDADLWPSGIGARNATAIDLNRDGLLDLVIADGSYGRKAEAAARLVVLENKGRFQFSDATAALGFPADSTHGLGLAVGDVNDDGRFDIFVAGSNRLFVSDAKEDKYREATPGRLAIPTADAREGMHCGAAFGDLDGDGRLDLVTTEHGVPARIHVFHNRAQRDGEPDFVEVSEAAGVGSLFPKGTREAPIKTAHVALADMDNDGKSDIVLTVMHRTEGGRVQPVVLRNLSSRPGELRFSPPPFDQMVTYYAPGPVTDYDRDGRLDIFLPSWFEDVPNALYRNITSGGNWLTVRVAGAGPKLNRMGIGATVRVYRTGHVGDPNHLVARRDIAVGTGYASTEEAMAHFGLGTISACDVEVTWEKHQAHRTRVAANQGLTVTMGQ
jgi:hypothetical protein